MAKSIITSICILLTCLCVMFWSGEAQTFQYSRGWTNGKRSNLPTPNTIKSTDRTLTSSDHTDFCKQLILSQILSRMAPISFYVYNCDFPRSQNSLHKYWDSRRSQIKHEPDPSNANNFGEEVPLNKIDSAASAISSSSSGTSSNDRYKR